jgi:deoxyribodipyrimidine photolyase-related protein
MGLPMGAFRRLLAARQTNPAGRRWVFVPYDQLTDLTGPLVTEAPETLGIVVVENPWKAARRPYHKQKLALILANSRHFALEQAARGVAVRHLVANGPYRTALEPLAQELGPIRMQVPAERELRVDLKPLADKGRLKLLPHEGWLTTLKQFQATSKTASQWRMDLFYRSVRRETGILMRAGKPVGGKFSFDSENRLPWNGKPLAPEPPTFPVDPIKEEVGRLIESRFSHHPGHLNLNALPATKSDAEVAWSWAKKQCLASFGPYEDAMSTQSAGLFHTRISSLLNIHRLLPSSIISDVLDMELPLASKEGFIRQVLGWREFVHHIHVATEGFRKLPTGAQPVVHKPADGGYGRWAKKSWPTEAMPGDPDGGAQPAFLPAQMPLPPAFWGASSGFACLDHIVSGVWREGYSHHITRLMVLSNLARLLDVSPRELTDWFWVAYTDAYDWVVEPNVLGMGTYAVGELMTTKPYVSGAAYINRMSDYCNRCQFKPRINCPLINLYWAFLARHRALLKDNPRLKIPINSLQKRTEELQRHDDVVYRSVQDRLLSGKTMSPENLP